MVRGARYVTPEVWSVAVAYCLEIHFGSAAGGSKVTLLFSGRRSQVLFSHNHTSLAHC